jgi:hypothetical protein
MATCDGEVKYENYQYKLRAATPMPKMGGGFVLHTFGAERNKIYSYAFTKSLPGSEEFRGQGGDFISANFNRLSDVSGEVFQGKIVDNTEYLDENFLLGTYT